MGIDWAGYQILPPELLVPPRNITREEAWRRHRLRLTLLPERLVLLTRLAEVNGLVLGERGRRDCDALEDWVHQTVLDRFPVDDVRPRIEALEAEMDRMPPAERVARFPDGKALMEAVGYDPHNHPINDPDEPVRSLIHDAGMLCGDELIARYPALSWRLKRGSPRNVHYHYTVLMGFTKAASAYDSELVFTYLTAMRGELWGDPHASRWPAFVAFAEQWA